MKHVGVIDIGKTNAKFAVVDVEAMEEVAVRTRPNTVLTGPPYPHFDVEGLWAFLKEAITDLGRIHPLDALSITTHGATAALIDDSGKLALPILDYEHDGPDDARETYDNLCPPFKISLTPRLPLGLNLGAQLFFQQRAWPEGFARTHSILTYPQYWAYRLTGFLASERTSLGCHTGLWDFTRNDFSLLVDALGIRDKFPPLRSAFDALGPIRPDLARQLGLYPATQVHCGIHDSNASLLPHILADTPPFSVVSTGTWVVVCAARGSVAALDERRDCLANIDALGRTIPSARFMGGREFSSLVGTSSAEPTAEAARRVLDETIMLLPSVQQGSGPFPEQKAQWTIPFATLDADAKITATSFYLALMTTECLDLTGADGPIIVEGPFALNHLYLQMLAAATGRKVTSSSSNATGTSLGAAMLVLGADNRPRLHYAALAPQEPLHSAMQAYASRWQKAVAARMEQI